LCDILLARNFYRRACFSFLHEFCLCFDGAWLSAVKRVDCVDSCCLVQKYTYSHPFTWERNYVVRKSLCFLSLRSAAGVFPIFRVACASQMYILSCKTPFAGALEVFGYASWTRSPWTIHFRSRGSAGECFKPLLLCF